MSVLSHRLLSVLLVVAAAVFPVFLYDRLVARHLLRERREPPPLPEVLELYHRAFYYATETTLPMFWLGIPTLQNPNDIWVTQELISRLKPDFIVETGTWKGGSASIWAMIQDQVNPSGRVVTIDIGDFVNRATLPPVARRKGTSSSAARLPRTSSPRWRVAWGGAASWCCSTPTTTCPTCWPRCGPMPRS